MDYNKLPSNSYDNKTPQTTAPTKPVVKGTLQQSEGKKIAQAFIGGSLEDIKNHTIYEVLIPGAKKIILDAFSLLLFGTPSSGNWFVKPNSSLPKVSYNNFWSSEQPKATAVQAATNSNAQFSYADPTFDTKQDAEILRDNVSDWLDRKGCITVAQFYDMAGITGYPYTMNNFGWKGMATMTNAQIQTRTNNGETRYILKMPRISPLKQEDWQ